MSLNKSSIHPSLNYLSKMNALCIGFHGSGFRAASEDGTLQITKTHTEEHGQGQ